MKSVTTTYTCDVCDQKNLEGYQVEHDIHFSGYYVHHHRGSGDTNVVYFEDPPGTPIAPWKADDVCLKCMSMLGNHLRVFIDTLSAAAATEKSCPI